MNGLMRVSTTTLERYRLFIEPEQEWLSEDEFLKSIRGEGEQTPRLLLGKAFGQILETPWAYQTLTGYQHGPFRFSAETMASALTLMDHRSGTFEAKATKQYGRSMVVAKADQIVGAHLKEHKTTLGSVDLPGYAESYQWRFLADLFEPKVITYHVFRLRELRDLSYEVREIESLNLFPYTGLHDDCAGLVAQFEDYIDARGLGDYLRARQAAA